MTRPRIKICCALDEAEAAMAVAAGTDMVGLVGPGLSGPEVRDDATIYRIALTIPPPVASVLLTRVTNPAALVAQLARTQTSLVQICDAATPETWAAVRRAAPTVRILQVVHVNGPEAVAEAAEVAPYVDALILDSGTPTGPTPVYGGTGACHDWSISAAIVAASPRPVFLAGGLHADNIAEAWQRVRPFGFDLCSGAREHGRMSRARLTAFFDAVAALR
jgi:phosphoribosylanthranilate isomerase